MAAVGGRAAHVVDRARGRGDELAEVLRDATIERRCAVPVKLCGSEGAYRGPSGKSYVFITFRDIKISKQPAAP